MANDRILNRVLKCTNETKRNSNFNPFLCEKNADNIAKLLADNLAKPDDEESALKQRIRKNLFELTQRLCNKKLPFRNPKIHSDYSDVRVKHFYLTQFERSATGRNRYKRKHDTKEDLRKLSMFGIIKNPKNIQFDTPMFEFGLSLLNFDTDNCKSAVSHIVKQCLINYSDFDKPSFEFLNIICDRKTLPICPDTYDFLCERLSFTLEMRLLNCISVLINEFSNLGEWASFNNEKIRQVFNETFPNYHILLGRIVKSKRQFTNFFYALTDLYMKCYYDEVIGKIISFILLEVKCRTNFDNLILLYPYRFNNIIFFLENDPDIIKMEPMLFNHVLELIDSLYRSSQRDFVFIMSHYIPWLSCYAGGSFISLSPSILPGPSNVNKSDPCCSK